MSPGHDKKRILVFAGFSVDTWSSIEQRYVWLEELDGRPFELVWLVHPTGSENAVVRHERNRQNEAVYVRKLKERGAEIIECDVDRRNILTNYRRLCRLFREHGIDAVYTHFSPLRYHVEAAARLCGVTVIRGEHNFTFHPERRFRWAKKIFWKWTTDYYVPVSEAVADHLVDHVASRDRVVAVPNGFDFSRRPQEGAEASRQSMLAELELPGDANILLCAARLHPSKRQHVLVEALDKCPPTTVLLFAGNYEHEGYADKVRRLVRSKGLRERVRFLGYRSDVLRLMNGAVVTLLPSRFEGLPNVVVESMSVGTPVIGSAIPSIRDIIRDGETGYLVDGDDARAIAALVRRFIAEPEHRREMGRRAEAAVVERFAKETFLRDTARALERAVGLA